MMLRTSIWSLVSAAALSIALTGCGGPAETADATHGHDHGDHKHDEQASSAHTHVEWWCAEHGVPEAECGQCSPKVAAELKKKGDWCAEHDRPDSQCFVCHPEYEAKFAARYEAKYGKAPPKIN